jgi:hypothetical protein
MDRIANSKAPLEQSCLHAVFASAFAIMAAAATRCEARGRGDGSAATRLGVGAETCLFLGLADAAMPSALSAIGKAQRTVSWHLYVRSSLIWHCCRGAGICIAIIAPHGH